MQDVLIQPPLLQYIVTLATSPVNTDVNDIDGIAISRAVSSLDATICALSSFK